MANCRPKGRADRADENIGHNDHNKECFSKYGPGLKDDHNDHDDDKIDD